MRKQINRIYKNIRSQERRDRADKAYGRYMRNIQKTEQYNADVENFRDARTMREESRAQKQIVNRQYSRNTYMGLNGG